MSYVLLVLFNISYSVGVSAIPIVFLDESACERAGQQWLKTAAKDSRPKWPRAALSLYASRSKKS